MSEALSSRDVEFISYLVKRLDLQHIKEVEINELMTRVVNVLLPDDMKVDIELLREIVLPRYEREEYPSELTPVHHVREISTDMMLAVSIAIEAEGFSRLKATGLGRLYIGDGEIETKGFWLLEIQEAEPLEQVVERTKKLEEYMKDFIIRLIIALIIELLARIFS